jgi:endonuclease/exonuclease/phosphatase family metal-dependent hydrolase
MKNLRVRAAIRIACLLAVAAASAAVGFRVPADSADWRSGPAMQAPEQIRILTYNVYTILTAPGIDQRIDLLAASESIRGYDVLILNELFNDGASQRLLAALRPEYPYQTPVVGRGNIISRPDCADNDCWNSTEGAPLMNGRLEDGGVAIVSRWPIQARHQFIYRDSCDVDGLASKGFAYIRIDINGTPVHIIGTHLQADPSTLGGLGKRLRMLQPCLEPKSLSPDSPCSTASQTAYEEVRLGQLRQISTWIGQQAIPADQMVIIGGDLNIDKEGNPAEYNRMKCVLNVSEPVYGGPPEADALWYTYDTQLNAMLKPEEASAYIDYILVRRDHAQPAQWHNDVIPISSFPANWDGGSARGYELSDHFPGAGYIHAADAPAFQGARP